MVAGKAVVAGLSAVTLVTILSGVGYHFKPFFSGEDDVEESDAQPAEAGAIAGRIVAVPAEIYRSSFSMDDKVISQLGDCAMTKDDRNNTVLCNTKFEGTKVYIPKGKMNVDVTRVETTEDILNHVMGGVGVTVGALGIISVTPKVKVAVTTKTNTNTLNLIASYEVNLGAHTLQHPTPKRPYDGRTPALYLSEIEYGGSEVFLVTLEFTSVETKTHVEVTITFKILWWSITAKVEYVKNTVDTDVKCRVQLKSSWRKDEEEDFEKPTIAQCMDKLNKTEIRYMGGPAILRSKIPTMEADRNLHYFYYFSSWQSSPYGEHANQALVNHDLEFLTEQKTELDAVLKRIEEKYEEKVELTTDVVEFRAKVKGLSDRLGDGLRKYHKMNTQQRQELRRIYGEGQDRAPQYFTRQLRKFSIFQ